MSRHPSRPTGRYLTQRELDDEEDRRMSIIKTLFWVLLAFIVAVFGWAMWFISRMPS